MLQKPARRLQREVSMVIYVPTIDKSIIGDFTLYTVDLWNSDYRLVPHGVSEVRALLRKFLPLMRDEVFYGPAPSFIGITIRSDCVGDVHERLMALLQKPGILLKLPTTEAELEAWWNERYPASWRAKTSEIQVTP